MNWIKRLMGSKVSAEAVADHLELTGTHTVLGLRITWRNATNATIFINELLFYIDPGGKEEPRLFRPLERFARVAGQRTFQKTAFTSITLPPGEPHAEQIRFLLDEPLDLPPGKYRAEAHITDHENTRHTVPMTVAIESKIKFRQTEEWIRDTE